ncbi:ras protein [Dendrothele bispora CBS 962.96]|uniref:Ras protein n=1 Tax=Dendrothele bispora (strain CBS 962.96) TaxID=1314807 RepID=A0A4S8LEH5_DENBC|nr:ras protein [Dendrothele bispora CBS 962.96]
MSRVNFQTEHEIVVLGDGAVGKSAMIVCFVFGSFVNEYDPTHEDSYRKQCLIENESVIVRLSEKGAGGEYEHLRRHDIQRAEGFILVYSTTSNRSFEIISHLHQEILQGKNQNTVPMVIVGNKCDLESEREVSINEGQDLARALGCRFFEASAKAGINVDEVFNTTLREIWQLGRETQQLETGARSIHNTEYQDSDLSESTVKCCCTLQ